MKRTLGLVGLALLCGTAFGVTAHLLEAEPVAAAQESAFQVTAAVPLVSQTQYEEDPFQPGLLRRSTVTVQEIALCYGDGRVVRVKPE